MTIDDVSPSDSDSARSIVSKSLSTSSHYFKNPLQQFQFFDKYSRFDPVLRRREAWPETVDRAVGYLRHLGGDRVSTELYADIRKAVLEMHVMPSMRLLAMAGSAAMENSVCIYNCAYMPIVDLKAIVEAFLITMSGCGVGYSVEMRYVSCLPRIKQQQVTNKTTISVPDTTYGQAEALREALVTWFDGGDVIFDLSTIRPAGSPLVTKGGTASGPEAISRMLNLIRSIIFSRRGQELRPIDAHDILCAIISLPIAGGVRPGAAMISLFDLGDEEMRRCKSGDFEHERQQRRYANNSAVWNTSGLSRRTVFEHLRELIESQRGEPGIFNRQGVIDSRPRRRDIAVFGTNPCGEVVLRPWQFCNLSSAIARRYDSVSSLQEKVRIAAAIGTIQSLATDFPGLRPEWKLNCESERLLGVDISGHMDSAVVQRPDIQRYLRNIAIESNRQIATALGICPSPAVTCVKPSGNSS